jgi:hypothetical protein
MEKFDTGKSGANYRYRSGWTLDDIFPELHAAKLVCFVHVEYDFHHT